jgi:hypothetical protein
MPDGSDAICFIIRGVYGEKRDDLVEKPALVISGEEEVTLDAYATYMSATHIENLGGQYREDLDGEKSVNLIAIVPADHVQNVGSSIKALPKVANAR